MGINKNVQFKETHAYEIVVKGSGQTGNGLPEYGLSMTGKPKDGQVKLAFIDSLGNAKWTTTVLVEDLVSAVAKLGFASGHSSKRGR